MDRLPSRPDEALAQRRTERRWIPVLIVTALILLVAQGAKSVADAMAGPTAPAVEVGSAVEIQPRPGWDVESISTSPPAARLHRGTVLLDVFVYGAEAGGAAAVAQRYVDEALRPGLASVWIGGAAETTLAGGVPAVRFGYIGLTHDGVSLEGVVIAASGHAASAVFDAYAPRGSLATVAQDLRVMIDGAVLR
ncbi:MAG: hypothetical protein ABJB55_10670 [Actinomycetota bacterium]